MWMDETRLLKQVQYQRGIGLLPTTNTENYAVDAYFWPKTLGDCVMTN
jgi:hypothetical protein